MPLNRRGRMKRTADEALNDIGRATMKLQGLAAEYGDTHAKHRDLVNAFVAILENVASSLAGFLEKYM